MFSVICAFYCLAIYLRKTWTGNNVYVFFLACYVGEIFGQVCFGASNLFSPWLVGSVLASASLVSMTSTLTTPESALVISFLSFMRFLSGSTLHGLPLWTRPHFAYFCGIAGCVFIQVYRGTFVPEKLPRRAVYARWQDSSPTEAAHLFTELRYQPQATKHAEPLSRL